MNIIGISSFTKIKFSSGSFSTFKDYLPPKPSLIVCTENTRARLSLDNNLQKNICGNFHYCTGFSSNPTLSDLQENLKLLADLEFIPSAIIAIGGGSTLDIAKVIKLYYETGYSPESFIENINNINYSLTQKSITSFAIPTTFGTGSEVTQYATIWDENTKSKISINSPFIRYDYAFIDPTLATTLSYTNTLYPALDALNQCFESIWNRNCTKESYGYAVSGIKEGLSCMLENFDTKYTNLSYRHKLAALSLYSGLSISITQTALCHSISYPLTSYLNMPHGLACFFPMQAVYNDNRKVSSFFLEQIEKDICHEFDSPSLNNIFERLTSNLLLKHHFAKYINEYSKVTDLASKMVNPARAANNLNLQPDLNKILQDSWSQVN